MQPYSTCMWMVLYIVVSRIQVRYGQYVLGKLLIPPPPPPPPCVLMQVSEGLFVIWVIFRFSSDLITMSADVLRNQPQSHDLQVTPEVTFEPEKPRPPSQTSFESVDSVVYYDEGD